MFRDQHGGTENMGIYIGLMKQRCSNFELGLRSYEIESGTSAGVLGDPGGFTLT